MEVGVIADLVAFALDALHEADVFLSFGADHHERALDIFLFENVENFRGSIWDQAVVEGEAT